MPVRHRPNGARVDPVRVAYELERPYKELFERTARRVGVSGSILLEKMVIRLGDELTDDGVPIWWIDEPTDQESLPLGT